MKRTLTLVLGLFMTASALAEKRYVTDQLWLQLRAGPSTEFRILKALKSGTHLIYLEENEDGQYTKVQTDKGLEGWVLSRFLLNDPIAAEKLILTQRELDKLKTDYQALQDRQTELRKNLASSQRDKSNASGEAEAAIKELERIKKVSANAIALDDKNKELMTRTQELQVQVDTLTADNDRLKDDRDTTWLVTGGGLVFLGIILGIILPRLRPSSRTGGGWN